MRGIELIGLALSLALSGCGGAAPACASGETRVCTCASGAAGTQTCSAGAFGACACASGDGGTDGGPDGRRDAALDAALDGASDAALDAGADASGPVDAGSECDLRGFVPTGTTTEANAADQWLLHTMTTADEMMYLELFFAEGASDTPHTFTFAPVNYADCHTCLLMGAECVAGAECGTSYLAESGSVTFTSLSRTQMTGVLEGVRMTEVEVDPVTFVSTPVPGGRVWCIPSLSFSGP